MGTEIERKFLSGATSFLSIRFQTHRTGIYCSSPNDPKVRIRGNEGYLTIQRGIQLDGTTR